TWGYPPFEWQSDLARHVLETSTWPGLVDLPTGLGKTAAIDIALFSMAADTSSTAPADRRLPHRIAMVVDRRVIVDQAHNRALTLAEAIANADDDVMAAVRAALASRTGGDEHLLTSVLRGGIVRDERW